MKLHPPGVNFKKQNSFFFKNREGVKQKNKKIIIGQSWHGKCSKKIKKNKKKRCVPRYRC